MTPNTNIDELEDDDEIVFSLAHLARCITSLRQENGFDGVAPDQAARQIFLKSEELVEPVRLAAVARAQVDNAYSGTRGAENFLKRP